MTSKFVALLYQSWSDLDRALEDLDDEEAVTRSHGGSAIGWTVGHVSNMADSWLNARFQGLPPHPVISNPDFRTGGSGDAADWQAIRIAVIEVRESARRFLAGKNDEDLDAVIPYEGSIPFLRQTGLQLRYALIRIAHHHWIHQGEIVTIRSRLRWVEPNLPDWGRGLM